MTFKPFKKGDLNKYYRVLKINSKKYVNADSLRQDLVVRFIDFSNIEIFILGNTSNYIRIFHISYIFFLIYFIGI